VDGAGKTHVYYTQEQHPSFKCTHAGAACSCTLKHPTHDEGGCKQLESKAIAGKTLGVGGDCTDSGKNTAAPTAAPTPAPARLPLWKGADVAADAQDAADGATINLMAGTFVWSRTVVPIGKTLTITGAGKGVTILDAGNVRRFFGSESNAMTLVLCDLTLENGNGYVDQTKALGGNGRTPVGFGSTWGEYPEPQGAYGGAFRLNAGSVLTATGVEFKGNHCDQVRCERAPQSRRAPSGPRVVVVGCHVGVSTREVRGGNERGVGGGARRAGRRG
jgi:hypothetical protein